MYVILTEHRSTVERLGISSREELNASNQKLVYVSAAGSIRGRIGSL